MAKLDKELFNDPFNDGALTGSLASDNMWIKWAIFISLALFVLLLVTVLLNWLIRYIDFKSPKTEVDNFKRASKIDIFLTDEIKHTLVKENEDFAKFVEFFNDEKQGSIENVHFVKANVYVDMHKYVLNFSNEGWNFSGEAKNCRKLNNSLGLILFLEKLEEEHFGR